MIIEVGQMFENQQQLNGIGEEQQTSQTSVATSSSPILFQIEGDDISGRWVKLWDSVIDCGLTKNANLFTFFCWCILKATYKTEADIVGFEEVKLERGQFIFGRKKASKELKMSEQTIRTCMKNLVYQKRITVKSTSKYSIVTVCKYNEYQKTENESNQQATNNQPTGNQQPTSDQPAPNHIQERKESKELKKEKNTLDSTPFEKWYSIYPKKKAREDAEKAFAVLNPDENLLNTMIAQTKEFCQTWDWRKENGKFVPYPATWIRQKRWTDVITEADKKEPAQKNTGSNAILLTAEEAHSKYAEVEARGGANIFGRDRQ